MDTEKEQIVMTPKSRTANSTTIAIERRVVEKTNESMFVAGGDHKGIVVSKAAADDNTDECPQITLEFRVYLKNHQTSHTTQEARILRFFFRPSVVATEQTSVAQNFFRDLVSPKEFPRDYVGFIKKIMKLLQRDYSPIKKIEIEMQQLENIDDLPPRPASTDEALQKTALTAEKLLEIIESSYPNPVTVDDLIAQYNWPETHIIALMNELKERNVVKNLENSSVAFTRAPQHADEAITVVKQMPSISAGQSPTIAIITALYCEKLAVDAMITNKETFVRYTTVGESNVYTLGHIGSHRVVCTKLPALGHSREAMTAAGNTVTRLLGTFQKVEYILLVGVAGGIPHYTDFNKHVRLGDVVISVPVDGQENIYVYCEKQKSADDHDDPDAPPTTPTITTSNECSYDLKQYTPTNHVLQNIARQLNGRDLEWRKYVDEGLQSLSSGETDFKAPPRTSDKLFMPIGERDLIEVLHPTSGNANSDGNMEPRVHLAPICSGRQLTKDDRRRHEIANQLKALAFDSEYDTVLESIIGNRKDSFVLVRGISDYKDGTKNKEWQPFAALNAAAVMRMIIAQLESV